MNETGRTDPVFNALFTSRITTTRESRHTKHLAGFATGCLPRAINRALQYFPRLTQPQLWIRPYRPGKV